jgi:hypothetical protein
LAKASEQRGGTTSSSVPLKSQVRGIDAVRETHRLVHFHELPDLLFGHARGGERPAKFRRVAFSSEHHVSEIPAREQMKMRL